MHNNDPLLKEYILNGQKSYVYDGYCGQFYSLIIKTDNTSQSAHDWVVVASCHRSNTFLPLKRFCKYYQTFFNLNELNSAIVKPTSDSASTPGSLLCDDEFNHLNERDYNRYKELLPTERHRS